MKSIFHELCERPRPAGSVRIEEVKGFIVSLLEKSGYTVQEDRHNFIGWELISDPRFSFMRPIHKVFECIPVVWSGSSEGEIRGRILPVFTAIKTFEAYDWQLYNVVDDAGKILANVMTRPDMVWAQPLDDCTETVPHLILDVEACKLINTWIVDKEDIEVMLSVKSRYVSDKEIANIVAASNPQEVDIIVSAHYDSMFNTVGAHDNASGTVALIKLSQYFSEKSNGRLGFIFFDAEEWNKYGSYCYVNKLKEQGALNQVKLVINIDSVGVGDHLYLLTSPSIEAAIREIVSIVQNSHELNVEISSKPAFPQFDSWPFMKNGIPVMQVGTRGTSGFPYFHHPRDDMSNIDFSLVDRVILFLQSCIENIIEATAR